MLKIEVAWFFLGHGVYIYICGLAVCVHFQFSGVCFCQELLAKLYNMRLSYHKY